MSERALVWFWGAMVASVLLLGSIWTLKDRIGHAGFGLWDLALLMIAGIGFCATFFVAARVAFVLGRIKKVRRVDRLGEG